MCVSLIESQLLHNINPSLILRNKHIKAIDIISYLIQALDQTPAPSHIIFKTWVEYLQIY